jgi:hypothetical protein
MTGVKIITKKALHCLAGDQLVSIQEAAHMVDKQELVMCSNSMTCVNISQGQVLYDYLEMNKRKDIITVYQSCEKNTTISLWSNSSTECLSAPLSRNPRMTSQMKTTMRMLSQVTGIESWSLRV